MKRKLLTLALLLGLAGCASPPDTRFYTLSDTQALEQVVPESGQAALRISRVQLPEYLDDRRLWVRTEAHRLEALPHVRWAEILPRAVTRHLQQRLGAMAETGEGRRLLVDLDHFEARWGREGESDRVVLSGRWQLEGHSGPAHPIYEAVDLEDRDAASLVAAKSLLLDRLAAQIVRAREEAGP